MPVGIRGDPWNRSSPSRRFAAELHCFSWLPDLLTQGEAGAFEGLRLLFAWQEVFGRWNAFVWSGEVLDRRVFNLACGSASLVQYATGEEAPEVAAILQRQARQLLQTDLPLHRRAQALAAAATAGAALSGKAADRLLHASLKRLDRALIREVLPDGGHATRCPEAGMDLLFDLLTLDDALAQRGLERSAELGGAIDRLTSALRFLTLSDGRLACVQGGEELQPRRLAAARAHDEGDEAPPQLPHSGYQRLQGRHLQVFVDAGAPARGPMSALACAQPLALEILSGKERLISNSGWSPRAPTAQALRLTDAGSTVSLGASSTAQPLSGFQSRMLHPRLVGGPTEVKAARSQSDKGQWLELSHDGWVEEFHLIHERRLFLDAATDELRGEDRFTPAGGGEQRVAAYAIRFHLYLGATATVARDSKSVLLRTAQDVGWWLRNDAHEVRIEPAVHFRDGVPKATQQVVLMGHLRTDKGGRVRWKLAPVE